MIVTPAFAIANTPHPRGFFSRKRRMRIKARQRATWLSFQYGLLQSEKILDDIFKMPYATSEDE